MYLKNISNELKELVEKVNMLDKENKLKFIKLIKPEKAWIEAFSGFFGKFREKRIFQ